MHVNEDTDDATFRKAAEDYLLSAADADWTTIQHKIHMQDATGTEQEGRIKNNTGTITAILRRLRHKWKKHRLALFSAISRLHTKLKKAKKKPDALCYYTCRSYLLWRLQANQLNLFVI
jgi:hypothetical protein